MKITLAHAHRHNGIEFLAGQTIDLPPALAQWMIDHWHTTEKQTVAPEKQPGEVAGRLHGPRPGEVAGSLHGPGKPEAKIPKRDSSAVNN